MIQTNDATRTLRGGLDLGGTKIQGVIVDEAHRVVGESRRAKAAAGGPQDVVAELANALRAAADGAECDVRSLASVGIGTPGAVDRERGTVASARNLPGFDKTVPLAALLEHAIGVQTFVGNDVGVAL